jgi:hypothetical protein
MESRKNAGTALRSAIVVGSAALGTLASLAQGALVAQYDFEGTTAATPTTYTNGSTGDTVSDTSGFGGVGRFNRMYAAPMPVLSSNARVGTRAVSLSAPRATNNISTGFVSLGNPDQLKISGPMTLSAWVNLPSPADNPSGQDIISKGGFGGNRGYILTVNSAGRPELSIARDANTTFVATGSTALPAGQYALVTGVFDPTGSATGAAGSYIYLNGVLVGSNTANVPAAQFLSTANANIGTRGVAPTNDSTSGLTGLVDDVRIYNEALSPAAVQALYTSVPEPTSLGLLCVAGLLLGRRRRALV